MKTAYLVVLFSVILVACDTLHIGTALTHDMVLAKAKACAKADSAARQLIELYPKIVDNAKVTSEDSREWCVTFQFGSRAYDTGGEIRVNLSPEGACQKVAVSSYGYL